MDSMMSHTLAACLIFRARDLCSLREHKYYTIFYVEKNYSPIIALTKQNVRFDT